MSEEEIYMKYKRDLRLVNGMRPKSETSLEEKSESGLQEAIEAILRNNQFMQN